MPRNLKRFSNFIGKSNWASSENIHACLDDLKIFNKALDTSEINRELSNEVSNKKSSITNLGKKFIFQRNLKNKLF